MESGAHFNRSTENTVSPLGIPLASMEARKYASDLGEGAKQVGRKCGPAFHLEEFRSAWIPVFAFPACCVCVCVGSSVYVSPNFSVVECR